MGPRVRPAEPTKSCGNGFLLASTRKVKRLDSAVQVADDATAKYPGCQTVRAALLSDDVRAEAFPIRTSKVVWCRSPSPIRLGMAWPFGVIPNRACLTRARKDVWRGHRSKPGARSFSVAPAEPEQATDREIFRRAIFYRPDRTQGRCASFRGGILIRLDNPGQNPRDPGRGQGNAKDRHPMSWCKGVSRRRRPSSV